MKNKKLKILSNFNQIVQLTHFLPKKHVKLWKSIMIKENFLILSLNILVKTLN